MNHIYLLKIKGLILYIYNFLDYFLIFKKNELRILTYHHISYDKINLFNKQLFYIKKNWKFISPKQFEDHINGKHKLKGRNVLLTFDDGFNSNFLIANNILKKLSIKSIFFVPSDFIKLDSVKKSRSFIKKNILDQEIPKNFDGIKNMSIKDLKRLVHNGHTIGAHTKSHANLAKIKSTKKLTDEIINSSKDLEKMLNIKIKHFAFTYGNYKSMSKKSINIAIKQFDYIYSSLRGNNFNIKKKEIIKRDTVYLELGNELLSIFMNGIIDIRYIFQVISINKIFTKNKK